MHQIIRHIVFVTLLVIYAVVVLTTGMKFLIISGRYSGFGIDFFALAAWCACYWRGPDVGGIDPYPYKSAAILIGVAGMIALLGFKMMCELR